MTGKDTVKMVFIATFFVKKGTIAVTVLTAKVM
jgi:hypothetical protein